MNFCKRSYQPILRYLYTETIKRGGEISLHKHFNYLLINYQYYVAVNMLYMIQLYSVYKKGNRTLECSSALNI